MSFFQWLNSNVQKMNWVDMSFVKLALVAFAFMLVSIWPQIADVPWYWYLIIWIVLAIKPMVKVFSKKKGS